MKLATQKTGREEDMGSHMSLLCSDTTVCLHPLKNVFALPLLKHREKETHISEETEQGKAPIMYRHLLLSALLLWAPGTV